MPSPIDTPAITLPPIELPKLAVLVPSFALPEHLPNDVGSLQALLKAQQQAFHAAVLTVQDAVQQSYADAADTIRAQVLDAAQVAARGAAIKAANDRRVSR
ncbi:hypothetical protein ACN9MZ_06200 [Pseudoduganella sp. S-14]|uniref:hypothetical protein n=1 Tax=Pseudoduganella sp. S-14 TaxID=3404065 RepID=UPI003CEAC18F